MIIILNDYDYSGSEVNRLDISGARRRSRSEVAPQWRRFEGVTLPSIRMLVWFRGKRTRYYWSATALELRSCASMEALERGLLTPPFD